MIAQRTQSNPLPPVALIILAALIFLAVTMPPLVLDFSQSHGIPKHGNAAEAVRQCLNDKGVLQVWKNQTTGRKAYVCQLDPTTFGIQVNHIVEGKWKELTSFIKDKMTRLDQVEKYLRNCGYQPMN
jgi:hypothetical protein